MNELRYKIAEVLSENPLGTYDQQADAIIAALPGMVPDLVWEKTSKIEWDDGPETMDEYGKITHDHGFEWTCVTMKAECGGLKFLTFSDYTGEWDLSVYFENSEFSSIYLDGLSESAAKATANKINRAQFIAGLGVVV